MLSQGFATARSVTTLMRDAQCHEFTSVLLLTTGAGRRSDIFTSQTVTTLIWATAI
ncbi:hypothetical protein EMIT0158MI4_20636 [Burkholderia ambifaria]